jgi:hypothetical protein
MTLKSRMIFSLTLSLALLGLVGLSTAKAESAEDLVVPSYRNANMLQFKVPEKGVHSISVLVKTYAKDGRVDQQLFELNKQTSNKGAFPKRRGFQMWESDKIYASHDQWRANRGNVDRIEFSYVVHRTDRAGQRSPVESKNIYAYARGGEARSLSFNTADVPAVGRNAGRGLDRLDPAAVQRAVDRLAKRPPAGRYKTLPGSFPHPMHPVNDLIKAVKSVTKAKQRDPRGDYVLRFSIYNQDSPDLSRALIAAHRAGVRVEGLTDWSQVTPKLASKPAHEMVRSAGVPIYSMVRNGPGSGDIRTNHTKFWIMGKLQGGKFVKGTVFDCSFNTEFTNYPGNQEAMTVFRNNRDVATVYNHMFQAMKGNAPLKLKINPARAKFILNHPLYPYVTPQGKSFNARDAMYTFINKAKRNLTMLDYVAADRDIAGAVGARAQKGAKVHTFLNAFWGKGNPNTNVMRNMGANVHLVHSNGGGSPIHHKEGAADKWVRGGSLNPGWWSFQSDETMYVIKSPKMASQVRAQANRLAHAYHNENLNGSQLPQKKLQKVQFEVRLPRSVKAADVKDVYFAGGGSSELNGSWVQLKQTKTRGQKTIYRGSRRLPLGFVHQGKPVIVLKSGQKVFSAANDTMFKVDPRKSGRQRIRAGFRPRR